MCSKSTTSANNKNTRKRCEICSKLKIKKQRNDANNIVLVFFNFECISYLFLVFILLTSNKYMIARIIDMQNLPLPSKLYNNKIGIYSLLEKKHLLNKFINNQLLNLDISLMVNSQLQGTIFFSAANICTFSNVPKF